jgi:hypothetical protein
MASAVRTSACWRTSIAWPSWRPGDRFDVGGVAELAVRQPLFAQMLHVVGAEGGPAGAAAARRGDPEDGAAA